MSVLSAGLVVGPTSPALRDLRLDSRSCGAKRRFSRATVWVSWWVTWTGAGGEDGEAEVGEGSGVGSAAGPPLRCSLKVVSIGTGANRLRDCVGCVMLCVVYHNGDQKYWTVEAARSCVRRGRSLGGGYWGFGSRSGSREMSQGEAGFP